MRTNLSNAAVTPQDNADVFPRPKAARVTSTRHESPSVTTDDNSALSPLSELVLACVCATYGKQDAAAAHLRKDPGNFTRDIKRWMDVLEQLGPTFLAHVGAGMVERYGPLADPKTLALRDLDDMDTLVKRLRQYVNFAE